MNVPEASPIRFNLQAALTDRAEWLRLARTAEANGFHSLYCADHPGSIAAPFVALAAAAAVTESVRLGTYVANAGVWEPMLLAGEVASLDVISEGRAVLGLGAGHTPSEWTERGVAYPSARERVDRLIEVAHETRARLEVLEAPRPRQTPIPLLIGGNGRRVLEFAAGHADIVGVTGLGRTLPDGHSHDAEWSMDAIDERIGHLRSVRSDLVIDALVQFVVLTDDRSATADALAAQHGLDPRQLLDCPYALIGSASEIAVELLEHHRRWGISQFTVRRDAVDAIGEVTKALADQIPARDGSANG